jgi:hypothetical protein
MLTIGGADVNDFFLALAAMAAEQTQSIRDGLTEKCAAILMGYRTFCAADTRSTQVLVFLFSPFSGMLNAHSF